MRVLVLGSGGREHALVWKISQSKRLDKLFVAPGNAGTQTLAENINLNIDNFLEIKDFVIKNQIEMLIVGPEKPLVNGIHDYFYNDEALKHITVIGPKQAGAKLEGSKAFSKQFMTKYNIPTAGFNSFTSMDSALQHLKTATPPFVIKADGLAAGKGVVIEHDVEAAEASIKSMMVDKKFGDAGTKIVIEDFLEGIELSVFVLTDGNDYVLLPEAKDYKRIGEGDTGLNTGGMGAISPVPFITKEDMENIVNTIIEPTINGLKSENIPYTGFIFFGLINTSKGFQVIEYNARMGDPEALAVLPRINDDLLDVFGSLGKKELHQFGHKLSLNTQTVATIVAASGGYPESFDTEKVISGLQDTNQNHSIVFHAGTKNMRGKTISSGGRVLGVSSFGNDTAEALSNAYKTMSKIHFNQMYYRNDIGFDL